MIITQGVDIIMTLHIKDLLQLDLLKDAEIVAGKNGANNEIVWVNMMEILDQFDSLQKSELLLTTGYGLNNKEQYKDLIVNLYKKGLAGIAIQPGYYINEIPEYLIECADRYDFPIIKVPKKVTFSHLTRAILKELENTSDDDFDTFDNSKNLLKEIFDGKEISGASRTYIKTVMEDEENYDSFIMVTAISHIQDGIILQSDIKIIIDKILLYLNKISPKVYEEKINNKYVLFFAIENDKLSQDLVFNLSKIITNLSKIYPSLSIRTSISNPFNKVDNISKAYENALIIQNIMEKIQAKKGILSYYDADLLQYIYSQGSKENVFLYMNNVLKPLLDYDKVNNSNFLNVLKYFLLYNGNMSKAAENLYIHRHTLRSRLEKIREICGFDPESFNSRLKYMLAIFIYNLYY